MKKIALILVIVMILALLPTGALAANGPAVTHETGYTFYVANNYPDPERNTRGYIDKYGDLYMWGYNEVGNVGNGTCEYQETPCLVLSHVISFHCEGEYSTALTETGDLYAWGRANRIGNGDTGNSYNIIVNIYGNQEKRAVQTKPVKVLENVKYYCEPAPGLIGVVYAITENNDLYAWGNNGFGMIGIGTVDYDGVHYPQKILSSVKKISTYSHGVYASTDNGDYFWGEYEPGKTGHKFPDGVQTAVLKGRGNVETDVITAPAPVKLLDLTEPSVPLNEMLKRSNLNGFIQIPYDKSQQTIEGRLNGRVTTVRKSFQVGMNNLDAYRLTLDGSLYKSGDTDKFIMSDVETYGGFGDIAYILTKDGTAYMYKAKDGSLTKLAENVAMPHSTITEDPYVRSLDSGAWYYDNVKYVYSKGMTEDIPLEDFVPGDNLTRAMLVQMLYNLEGRPKMAASNAFDDVKTDDWYYNATIWGTENGIINGYGNGKFGPNDPILREQVVAILYRYAKFKGVKTSKSDSLSAFTDRGSISAYALSAMKWAVAEGIINGTTKTTIKPRGNNTCAQMSAIVMRYCENIL